jgi:hypothetical protein
MNIVGISGKTESGKDTIADRFVDEHNYVKISLSEPIKLLMSKVFCFSDDQLQGSQKRKNAPDRKYGLCEIRSSSVSFGPDCDLKSVRRVCDDAWGKAAENLLVYGPVWLAGVLECSKTQTTFKEGMQSLCNWFAILGHKFPTMSPRIVAQSLGTEWGRNSIHKDIWIDYLLNNRVKTLQETNPNTIGVIIPDVRFDNELTIIKEVKGKLIRVLRTSTDTKARKVGIQNHTSETDQEQFSNELFDVLINNKGTLKDLYEVVDVTAVGFANSGVIL